MFIASENRNKLLQHVHVCWSVDYMFRLGCVKEFPQFE